MGTATARRRFLGRPILSGIIYGGSDLLALVNVRSQLFCKQTRIYRDMNLDLKAMARERLMFRARSCVFRSVEGIVMIRDGVRTRELVLVCTKRLIRPERTPSQCWEMRAGLE